jgi:hypothetical protein
MSCANVEPLGSSDEQVRAAACDYHGYTVLNTDASAACTVAFHRGTSASGELLGAATLLAGESIDIERVKGVYCEDGVYMNVTGAGTFIGSLYWG